MELLEFAEGTPWGIDPRYYETARSQAEQAVAASENGEKVHQASAVTGEYLSVGGVAVIKIHGPITPRETFWSWIFDWPNVEHIEASFLKALSSPDVSSILLDIDSPGGTVGGVSHLAARIREASKPVVAFSGGMMASAAYWIASGAQKIIIDDTTDIGSIGVLTVHYDRSERDKANGLKRTYITAGEYKALGNDAEPLSIKGREEFQGQIDYLYAIFVEAVAAGRGVSVKQALKMADGKIFIGEQGVKIGLADEIGDINMAVRTARGLKGKKMAVIQDDDKNAEVAALTSEVNTLTEKNNALNAALEAATIKADALATEAAAAKEENKDMLALADAFFSAEESERFKKVIATGVTAEQYAAVSAVSASALAPGKAALDALRATGADNPGNDPQRAEKKKESALVADARRRAKQAA